MIVQQPLHALRASGRLCKSFVDKPVEEMDCKTEDHKNLMHDKKIGRRESWHVEIVDLVM